MSIDAVAMSPGGTTEVPMETEPGLNDGMQASTSTSSDEPSLLQPFKSPDGKGMSCNSLITACEL